MNDLGFCEDYQRACDKLCNAMRESNNYRDLVRIEFVPDPNVDGEPLKAICWFRHVHATVNIRFDNVWGMYLDILNHLDDIAKHRIPWG